MVPGACYELDDGAEEEECAVEGEADISPMPPKQPIQHLEPLQVFQFRVQTTCRKWYIQAMERSLETYLDDMVPEVRLLPLLPRSVLQVEDADEIGGPAPHQAVEELEQYAAHHPQLQIGRAHV